jgi:hypothetical protein
MAEVVVVGLVNPNDVDRVLPELTHLQGITYPSQ